MTTVVFPGYVNHISSCVDAAGNIFAAATQDGPLPGGVDVDIVIRRRDRATGAWTDVKRFSQALYGKHGYGTLEVVGSDLICILSEENAGSIDGIERIVPGVAVPFGAGGAAGTVDQTARNLIAGLIAKLRAV